MRPLPDVKSEKVLPIPESPVKPNVPPSSKEVLSETRPITILSELDSYIAERMKGQPPTLEEAVARVRLLDDRPRHRLHLPDFFERLSADRQGSPGPYVFRWISKQKRAVDTALARGWLLITQAYFPNSPRYLFTANGGIEIGDALLAFMEVKKARTIRDAPGRLSRERLKAQMTQTKPDYVLMTGNQQAEHVYQPELGPEQAEASEEKVAGVLTEGRDF